jgi:type I restriction enzyme M protein
MILNKEKMTDTTQQHRAKLHKHLWEVADSLRGQMNASEFQNYALGVIFYKYLSEKTEIQAKKFINDDTLSYVEAWEDEEDREEIVKHLTKTLGYAVEPGYLYSTILDEIQKGSQGNWSVDLLQSAFNKILESTVGAASEHDFEGLFSDVNLTSPTLGKDIISRSETMGKVLTSIGRIDFHLEDAEIDVLGDAYEYMIAQFASGAGKKGGEFYTPQQVSLILAKIVANNNPDLKSIYDPTCGSGSLLLRVYKQASKESPENAEMIKLYGQELNTTTYNLARMNLILHGVSWKNFDIRNGDTLKDDLHKGSKFDSIIANPPYSADWSPTELTLQDERFAPYGKLAPKSKADYAFMQNMMSHLGEKGTMTVVLPHGVLFRGAAEGVIRTHLIEKQNVLDAVIGLPENIFYGTGIPTCILVFKKGRKPTDDILFIDASKEFTKGKAQNHLTEDNVNRITKTYSEREVIEKYSRKVSLTEIVSNDYNLNIPRYINSNEAELDIDLIDLEQGLKSIDNQLTYLDIKILRQLNQLSHEDDNE